jgi:hypothetical protein
MANSIKIPEEWVAQVGTECFNCGSSNDVSYRHIIALNAGGRDTVKNVVCVCSTCLSGFYSKENAIKRVRGGRKTNISDEAAFKLFDMLANGEIGLIKCMRSLGYSDNTRLSRSPQYARWQKVSGIRQIKTNYDYVATNNPFYLRNGNIIGTVITNDGPRNILYHFNPINDVKYCMVKFTHTSKTYTVEEFYEMSGIKP